MTRYAYGPGYCDPSQPQRKNLRVFIAAKGPNPSGSVGPNPSGAVGPNPSGAVGPSGGPISSCTCRLPAPVS
ncbi:unnamed protein product [Merluccius merluccius]